MKKAKLGDIVIFFPAASDREARENGATELAAVVSQVFDGDDTRVNLRIFNHATNGDNVPLRIFVPHKDEIDAIRPYYQLKKEVKQAEKKNLSVVSTSRNEEGVGPQTENSAGEGVTQDGPDQNKNQDAGIGKANASQAEAEVPELIVGKDVATTYPDKNEKAESEKKLSAGSALSGDNCTVTLHENLSPTNEANKEGANDSSRNNKEADAATGTAEDDQQSIDANNKKNQEGEESQS